MKLCSSQTILLIVFSEFFVVYVLFLLIINLKGSIFLECSEWKHMSGYEFRCSYNYQDNLGLQIPHSLNLDLEISIFEALFWRFFGNIVVWRDSNVYKKTYIFNFIFQDWSVYWSWLSGLFGCVYPIIGSSYPFQL